MEALEWPPFFSPPKRGAFVAMLKLSLQKRKTWLRRAIKQSQYNNLQWLQALHLIAHTNEQHQSIKTDECRSLSLSLSRSLSLSLSLLYLPLRCCWCWSISFSVSHILPHGLWRCHLCTYSQHAHPRCVFTNSQCQELRTSKTFHKKLSRFARQGASIE